MFNGKIQHTLVSLVLSVNIRIQNFCKHNNLHITNIHDSLQVFTNITNEIKFEENKIKKKHLQRQ